MAERPWWLPVAMVVPLAVGAVALPPTHAAQRRDRIRRTEVREPCARYERLRRPFFGDLHVHTTFSFDAQINGNTLNGPTEAYEFARGMAKLVPYRGGTRSIQLRRALDFAAVTDHSEYFGETRICTTPGSPGYDSIHCNKFRDEEAPPANLSSFDFWGANLIDSSLPPNTACATPGVCEGSAATVWSEIQEAAEVAYDRSSSACTFTSFVGYEYTGSTNGFNGHRNVIFRNAKVPAVPTSAFETDGTDAPALWRALTRTCVQGVDGCEVLTIPHNSNLSGGTLFTEPDEVAGAKARALFEPLVEIAQIKGASECRFDNLLGQGAGTTDELCNWENSPRYKQAIVGNEPATLDIGVYPQANMVRNVLKSGLAVERRLGVNPFKLGIIGGTDTHNGTPGAVEEDEPAGTHGFEDDTPVERVQGRSIYENPGSLAVLWAEENSRDALFEAMRRRETYGTSGTRPVVRFFGGWSFNRNLCRKRGQIGRAYAVGVPMGSDLPKRRGRKRLRFFASAFKDPGTDGHPGTDLQRIQVVKGWLDANGETHEQVFDVAGDAANGAGVDPETCAPTGAGAADLCTVWEDPTFDPAQPAFYYVRVLENPSCRWSTRICKDELQVNPFSPLCAAQAAAVGQVIGQDVSACCLDATSDPFVTPTTQERAWTSPIWYRPAGSRRAPRG